ncbi:MAG: S8 family peptidase [Clostridiaceae bacterium]|nr:S8 family peptidase [Clostridiaceae bacterium]
MDEVCNHAIYSEDYLDYLVEYYEENENEPDLQNVVCQQLVSPRYAVLYEPGQSYDTASVSNIKIIPRCYGLLSSDAMLETIGATRVQRNPNLNYYGNDILIGFIDTGIDYAHPAFIGSDGKTRILGIWDQTMQNPREGEQAPADFEFGVEYTPDQINLALESRQPLDVVPTRDTNGHGTFMAGIACGNRIEEQQFSGVAPLSSICVVKCKEAKQNLKDYYFIHGDEPCYAESDIMLAIRYVNRIAKRYRMTVIYCVGMGTSQGAHLRGGVLGEFLQEYGDYRGNFVITAGGNEGNTSHHYRSDSLEPDGSVEVEVRVGADETGFTTQLWTDVTNLYSVALISPDGEYSGKTEARLGEKRQINFLFEKTVVYIEYLLISHESGDECIQIRFRSPAEGIWRIRVFNENKYSTRFDMWLPIRNFLSEDTYFLRADPDTTLCDPSNNTGLISCSYYNSYNRSVEIEASRGFTRDGGIKPDFAAPGVEIYGPLPFLGNYPADETEREERARYGYRSGSSYAAAITAGTVAILAEWAIIDQNDLSLDTVKAQKYLIRGADRSGITVPNQTWGNGTLDIYNVFDSFRPQI